MKFDDQLAAYLYKFKSLRLEGLGTFTLDDKVSVPNEQEKEVYYPIEGLLFNYNPKCATDENVIAFLVKKLGKIEPLIKSDLESYLSNIKQFLNIGNPYTIKGIGTLSKNNYGIYEFTPGNFMPVKEELNPIRENAEHNYPVKTQLSAGRVLATVLIIIAALAVLGGLVWGISLLMAKERKQPAETEQQQGKSDTIPQQTFVDTIHKKEIPAVSLRAPQIVKDTIEDRGKQVNYKMIFEITRDKERALSRTAQLHDLHSYTQYDSTGLGGSTRYRLFLPVKIRPADTARAKDSLSIFFGDTIFIVKQ